MNRERPAQPIDLAVGTDSEVVLHCRIVLGDGTVAEETRDRGEPLCFRVGDGTLLARLERLLIGMHAGECRAWDLAPDEAFGQRDEANIQAVSMERFPPDIPPAVGHVIAFELPGGDTVPGTVLELLDDGTVRVDFNHPLAGRALRFEVEMVAVAETA